MNLNGVTQFSAFRSLPGDEKRRKERIEAWSFFDVLQNHVSVEDVVLGPDPPDFIVSLADREIGVELTRLNPRVFNQGGYSRIADFKAWENEAPNDPSLIRQFPWGKFTVRETLQSFRIQVERKARDARRYASKYSEVWLLFHAENGPVGGLVHRSFDAKFGHNDSVLNFAGKQLFEMNRVCRMAQPFSYVILFSGLQMLAFQCGGQQRNLPGPDIDLFGRGAKASDEYLNWRTQTSSITRRWDAARGDFAEWPIKRPTDRASGPLQPN